MKLRKSCQESPSDCFKVFKYILSFHFYNPEVACSFFSFIIHIRKQGIEVIFQGPSTTECGTSLCAPELTLLPRGLATPNVSGIMDTYLSLWLPNYCSAPSLHRRSLFRELR